MDKQDLDAASAEAWKEVLTHPAADLKSYITGLNVQFTGGLKPQADYCPLCQGKKKLGLIPGDGNEWTFKCFGKGCPSGGERGGIQKFIEVHRGVDWKDARRILHELTGVPDPWQVAKEEREKAGRKKPAAVKEPEPEPEQEPVIEEDEEELAYESNIQEQGDYPNYLKIPEKNRTVYEAAWLLMTLTPAHREELRQKRAMTDGWIEAFALRSACAANREALAPLLEQFPPNELLRSGIAERDPRDRSLRISDVICGREHDDESNRWVTVDRVVIPYIDGGGRIVMLRPHKKSLSNGRWRDREAVAEEYEKQHNNLRIPYGEVFLTDRPPGWEKTAGTVEGEFKSMALRMCGIPALAFQGIQYFTQNKETKEAVEKTAEILRSHGVRETFTVFDTEDKSDRDFDKQFDAEIYARFTAEELENKGFRTFWGMLPKEWMEDGKVDWDSRLAWHVRQSKSFAAGVAKAKAEFERLLNDRPRKNDRQGGRKPAMLQPQYQVDWLNPKEDVINQALYRLRYDPKIFVGGRYELNLASEIQNFCIEKYAHKLNARKLCQELRDTVGGYYKVKTPSDKLSETAQEILEEIKPDIIDLEKDFARNEDDEEQLRKLRATRTACYTALYRYPKPFTDFSAESKYKVLVTEMDGSPRHDRLIVFRDQNGVRSKPLQLSPKLMGSSQELRKFFLAMGHYHWKGGQDECDLWAHDLDLKNYQKTIEEIDTYGWNDEHKFYLLGDCAVVDVPGQPSKFIFPDKNGIIWIHQIGYKNSDTMGNFTTQPPVLFPGSKDARKDYEAIDWEQERIEVERIWDQVLADFSESFGGYAGYAFVSAFPQYLAHAEIRTYISGKPGLWVQGEKGSGKTKSVEYGMRLIGYPLNFGYITLGGTKVGLERSLSQFNKLPFLVDEWRYENVDAKIEDLIRSCYNEISTAKGTPNGNKGIRKSTPLTIPIICGENATNDAALRSRYLKIIASATHGQHFTGDEDDATRERMNLKFQQERDERFFNIMERSEEYYRVGRYIFRHRAEFAKLTVENAKAFAANSRVMEKIRDSRSRQVFGCFMGSYLACQQIIRGTEATQKLGKVNAAAMEWFIAHGAEAAQETEQEVFRKQFFRECLTMIELGHVQGIDKLIRVRPGQLQANGTLRLYSAINEPNASLYVLVAGSELYAEYTADKRKRGENPSITRLNIMSELRTQLAWVPAPKPPAPRQHRFGIPNEPKSGREWWVMDFKRLDSELKTIFQTIYERELEAVNILPDDPQGQLGETCPI